MTTYAKLLRAAATLKRVRAGLDSLAASAQSEEERERLRRAAAQARVMEQGLERRIRKVAAEEPEYARQSPGGELFGADGHNDHRPPARERPEPPAEVAPGEPLAGAQGSPRRRRGKAEPVAAGRGAAGGGAAGGGKE
ncbi:translation initiation factor IF-2 [Thermaerobacter sp. PB12/4term]|uniref:translation initiation factor IF-2 n=1 Tax=Thermaerobacter sp. PB12/4term TaxID=2293838 RepID=UPI000E32A23D|nr:translation initiation factor IF-2 [Thermaerobacter sp. PB12/4term]QIA27507.1 translation initiation factor IF-2 [Thermaerobacter sp. PB12/4term]